MEFSFTADSSTDEETLYPPVRDRKTSPKADSPRDNSALDLSKNLKPTSNNVNGYTLQHDIKPPTSNKVNGYNDNNIPATSYFSSLPNPYLIYPSFLPPPLRPFMFPSHMYDPPVRRNLPSMEQLQLQHQMMHYQLGPPKDTEKQ